MKGESRDRSSGKKRKMRLNDAEEAVLQKLWEERRVKLATKQKRVLFLTKAEKKVQNIEGDGHNDPLKAHVDNKKEVESYKETIKLDELKLNRERWEEGKRQRARINNYEATNKSFIKNE